MSEGPRPPAPTGARPLALRNCEVHTGEAVLRDRAVLLRDGLVADLRDPEALPAEAAVVDLGGAVLAPGFVDLQVNGGGDVLFNDDPTPAGVERILAAHRRLGTTDLLLTWLSDRDERTAAALAAVRCCLRAGAPGLLGIHLEGPFLDPERAGVHDPALTRPLRAADLDLLRPPQGGRMLLTLAPERAERGLIRALVERGVKVSAGHSTASRERMEEAFAEGLDCGTHLFNAMPPICGRDPGVAGSILAEPGAAAAVIADGHHLDPATVRLVCRAKGAGGAFLVSDAMPPAGGVRDEFRLGGGVVAVLDGCCRTAAGRLAGSASALADGVRHLVGEVGLPAEEALRMASLYPAAYIGLGDRLGRVEPGYRANLVVLDADLRVGAVLCAGAWQR